MRLTLNTDGTATLEVRGLKTETHRDFAPGTLRAAVHTERASDGDTYRLMRLIDAEDGSVERLRFTHTFSSWGAHDAVARRIMDWRAATG